MIRKACVVLVLFGAMTLAACTTQPAIPSSDISALHSGKLVIEQSPKNIAVLTPGQMIQLFNAGFTGSFIAGMTLGFAGEEAAEGATYGENAKKRSQARKALEPYRKEMDAVTTTNVFLAIGKQAVSGVPWLGTNDARVGVAATSGSLSGLQMEKLPVKAA